jgi:outer membrane receptor protein involved in Fe transport
MVLLNGHRLAPVGLSGSVDLSALPLSIVDRVEVLTDGASAIYGSDAVGGVINFITDKSFDGARTDLEHGGDTHGDVYDAKIAQTLGRNWGSGNGFGTFEYYEKDPLLAEDRSMFSSFAPRQVILPSQRRYSGFGSVNQELGSGISAWGNILYSKQKKTSTDFVLDTTESDDTEELSLTAGLKVDLSRDWGIDVSGYLGTTKVDRNVNPFSGPSIPESIANRSHGVDIQGNGRLFDDWAGSVRTAFGTSYRSDGFSDSSAAQTVPLKHRDIRSGFAEVDIPLTLTGSGFALTRALELNVAGRFDSYSDFGSTWNPKIGLTARPVDGLKLRASWGTSFRAPDFFELYEPNYSYIVDLPDPTALSGATRLLFYGGGNSNLGPEKADTLSAGLDVGPELLDGFHLSATFYDVRYRDRVGLGVSNFIDALVNEALEGPQVVQRNPSQQTLANLIAHSPEGVFSLVGPYTLSQIQALVVSTNLNLAQTHQNGLDLLVDKTWQAGTTQLTATLDTTYIFTDSHRVTAITPQQQLKNTAFNPPSFRARAGLNASLHFIDVSSFLNYTTSYRDTTVIPVGTVNSYTTIDAQVRARLGDVLTSRLARNLSASLSVRNLFDRGPPRLAGTNGLYYAYGFDPANADPIGRFISLRLVKDW